MESPAVVFLICCIYVDTLISIWQMKPDEESSLCVCFTSYCETPKRAEHDEKWMCSLEGSHPSVLQHTLCTVGALCPLSLNPQRGYAALQSPRWGVTYETLHPRIPHVPDHSARLAKLPLLCSHYPFNFSQRGVSFLLLRLIQVQSIITPRGIG